MNQPIAEIYRMAFSHYWKEVNELCVALSNPHELERLMLRQISYNSVIQRVLKR